MAHCTAGPLSVPQPTPELCRCFHGIDCRMCINTFATLDKLVAMVEAHQADSFRRHFDECQQRAAEFERRWARKHATAEGGEFK